VEMRKKSLISSRNKGLCFWFRKSLILKPLEAGEASLSGHPIYIILPAHPFAFTE